MADRLIAITKRFVSMKEIKQGLAGADDPDPNDMRGDEIRLQRKLAESD